MDMKIRRQVWKKRRRRREFGRRLIIIIGILLLMAAIILGGRYFMSKKAVQNDKNNTPAPTEIPGNEKPTVDNKTNQEEEEDNPLDTEKNDSQEDVDKEKETEDTNKEDSNEDTKGEETKEETKEENTAGEDTTDSKDTGTEYYEADEKYFDDVLFIGDSRTVGFEMYSGLTNATFYADKGVDIKNIYEKTPIKQDGKNVTILEALKGKSFGKIYIMLGVNELGWVYDSIFIEKYSKLIDDIQQLQPNAKIVIESIIHVTKEKSDSDTIYTNKIINSRNKLIKKMAEDKKVYYLDVNEVLTDKDGSLYAEASKDGIHLNKKYCLILKEFLMKNAIQ
jgi:lysophospholipase L1-like esterase